MFLRYGLVARDIIETSYIPRVMLRVNYFLHFIKS
jgi:hypothetical protein